MAALPNSRQHQRQAERKSVKDMIEGIDGQSELIMEMATSPERDDEFLSELVTEIQRRKEALSRYADIYSSTITTENITDIISAIDTIDNAILMYKSVESRNIVVAESRESDDHASELDES